MKNPLPQNSQSCITISSFVCLYLLDIGIYCEDLYNVAQQVFWTLAERWKASHPSFLLLKSNVLLISLLKYHYFNSYSFRGWDSTDFPLENMAYIARRIMRLSLCYPIFSQGQFKQVFVYSLWTSSSRASPPPA